MEKIFSFLGRRAIIILEGLVVVVMRRDLKKRTKKKRKVSNRKISKKLVFLVLFSFLGAFIGSFVLCVFLCPNIELERKKIVLQVGETFQEPSVNGSAMLPIGIWWHISPPPAGCFGTSQ